MINQYYISAISDNVFNNFSKESDVNCNICEILDEYSEFPDIHRKKIEDDYDSKFKVYTDINQEEKSKYVNVKFSKLPIHEKFQKKDHDNVIIDFEATSLYRSGMWDEKSVYRRRKAGFAFKPYMNDFYLEVLKIQSFNQDVNESAILKFKFYNPPDSILQHLPVKGKVKIIEFN